MITLIKCSQQNNSNYGSNHVIDQGVLPDSIDYIDTINNTLFQEQSEAYFIVDSTNNPEYSEGPNIDSALYFSTKEAYPVLERYIGDNLWLLACGHYAYIVNMEIIMHCSEEVVNKYYNTK